MENKCKHLEFIEGVITRMNTNSFIIKGWVIALISALFALAARNANLKYVLVAYISLPMFWILDGFYLSKERQYRDLYKDVTKVDELLIDFLMDTEKYKNGRNTWLYCIFSKTLMPFYGVLFIVTLVVMFVIN